MRYEQPATLAEAFRLRAEIPGARWIAGGTDLLVRLRDGGPRPPALISLRRVRGLAGIVDSGALRIGALTPIADVAASPVLYASLPALVEAAQAVGSVQIRNAATVGGNLCNASPCADLAPALLIHEAICHVEGPAGARELPIEALFTGPGRTSLGPDEILVAISLPRPPAGARAAFEKQGRVAMDLSLASVALSFVLEGGRMGSVRVAAGAVAPTPVRLRTVEALLEGKPPSVAGSPEVRAAAAAEIRPICDLRASDDFRRHLVGALLARAARRLDGGLS